MMISGAISSISPQLSSFIIIKNPSIISSKSQNPSILIANFPQNPSFLSRSSSLRPIYCSSSPSPGENESKTVLDAFFLGKALGEALTERIESTVGEVLSTIGRLQAEQQKQVLEFQEDVFERAKRAKEKAAREALEEQGRLISKSSTISPLGRNGAVSSARTSAPTTATSAPTSATSEPNSTELGTIGDENRTDSEPSGLISRIKKDV